MAEKTDLQIGLLRLLVLLLAAVAVASAGVHLAVQSRLDTVSPSDAPSMYALLSVQTWLQATIIGGMLVLIGYFVLLPVARRVDASQKALEEKEAALEHARRHDNLTGLPEWHNFEQFVEHALAVGRRHNHAAGLLRIRLAGIRGPKSALDLSTSDALVSAVAKAICETIREADRPARLGDEEFAVLVPMIKSVEGLGRLAERLVEEIGEALGEHGREKGIGCSIGIAVGWPSERQAAAKLLERSAQALDDAEDGGSVWRYHASAIQGMTDRISATG